MTKGIGKLLFAALLLCQLHGAALAQAKVVVRVSGLIAHAGSDGSMAFDAAALDALPEHSFSTTSPWFKTRTTFAGPYLSDLLDAVGAKGTQLSIAALNDYVVQVPVSDAIQYRPILARKINGKPITVRDKGPLFLIYPFDADPGLNNDIYFARSIWQIKTIRVD